MATVTQKIFTCDLCGDANDVQKWAFGFDGKRYEIDLCPKDSNGLDKVVAGYAAKARKVTARRGQQRNGHRPKASHPGQRAAKSSGAGAKSVASKKEARTSRSQPQDVMAAPEPAVAANPSQPPQDVMAPPKQTATNGRSRPQDLMAPPKQAAKTSRSQPQKAKAASKQADKTSHSRAQKAKAAPKQAAAASRSRPQEAKAAPNQAAKTSRSQLQEAKGAVKQAATASRSQPQEEKAAPKQAATASRSRPQEAKAAPNQAAKTSRSQPQEAKVAPKQAATASRSRPQEAKAAPNQAAKTSRSQPQEAKVAPKQAATASRSRPQEAKAAPNQAAKTSRSRPQEAKAAPKQAAKTSRSRPQKAKAALKLAAMASRSQLQKARAVSKQAAKARSMQQEKGIYVYGILPADIEVAGETQGVGEHPGPLGVVSSDGLAALISEVALPGRLGSPEDLRTYREILDSTAVEVPVVPLRFGTVFTGEASVTDELLAPRHDEFAAALEQLEGRAQFLVKGRYIEEARTARREEDARALQRAMEGISVDSVVREPAHEREAVHVAFLVDVDQEREVELVIEDLAREWAGRIEVRLLGPMAAYDFVMTDSD
jgi:hypothetical protein